MNDKRIDRRFGPFSQIRKQILEDRNAFHPSDSLLLKEKL